MLAIVSHCLLLSTVCLGDVPEFARACTPVLVAFVEEGDALRRDSPERWKEYEDVVEAIFEKRARRLRGWHRRSRPPRVDLSPANLPLSFLIVKAFREGPRPRWCYFDAIIKSSDERRIDAVLGMHAEAPKPYRLEVGWGPLVAAACTSERAAVLLPLILGEDPEFHRLSLEFKLIDRFASELPVELRRPAYDYIRGWLKTEDRDQNPKHSWDALFRLDRDRARHDSLGPPPEGLTTERSGPVRLWLEYAGESMEVATWARKWLWEHEYPPHSLETTQWLDLILRSDPKGRFCRQFAESKRSLPTIRAGIATKPLSCPTSFKQWSRSIQTTRFPTC